MSRLLRVEVAAAAMHGGEDASALAQASPIELALTGMLFGLIHVLTGPDHLSALATLSAGSSWRSFALGIRWGCGHSIGLIVMAVVFIALDGKLDFSVLNVVTDVLVGVFMVALGVYGIHEGVTKYRSNRRARRGGVHALKKKKKLKAKQSTGDLEAGDAQTEGEEEEEEEDPDHTETDSLASDPSPLRLLKKGENSSSQTLNYDEDEEGGASPTRQRKRLDREQEKTSPVIEDMDEKSSKTAHGQTKQTEATNMEAIALDDSPTDSVALQELLSSRSEVSDADTADTSATGDAPAKTKRGPVCCGWKLPSIDFQNAQTQKVWPMTKCTAAFHSLLRYSLSIALWIVQ